MCIDKRSSTAGIGLRSALAHIPHKNLLRCKCVVVCNNSTFSFGFQAPCTHSSFSLFCCPVRRGCCISVAEAHCAPKGFRYCGCKSSTSPCKCQLALSVPCTLIMNRLLIKRGLLLHAVIISCRGLTSYVAPHVKRFLRPACLQRIANAGHSTVLSSSYTQSCAGCRPCLPP